MPICKICNKTFKQITHTHLKSHGLSIDGYTVLYPSEQLYDDALRRLYDTASIDSFIRRFGPILGKQKYNDYVEFHKNKNSFEWKSEKYGWSKTQFDDFNKSRAVTLSNMIDKYGEEIGKLKYNEYCDKQKYAGCKVEYFIDKHGVVEGRLKYKSVCDSKAFTLENFIKRYGIEIGEEKFIDAMHIKYSPFSKISQKLFNNIVSKLNITDCYYATFNKEFGKYDKDTKRYKKYDFVIPSLKFCIEFNGDIYHANPKKFKPNEKPRFRGNTKTAKEIWELDALKNKILENEGFQVVIIWESDYNENTTLIEDKLCTLITQLQASVKLNQ